MYIYSCVIKLYINIMYYVLNIKYYVYITLTSSNGVFRARSQFLISHDHQNFNKITKTLALTIIISNSTIFLLASQNITTYSRFLDT